MLWQEHASLATDAGMAVSLSDSQSVGTHCDFGTACLGISRRVRLGLFRQKMELLVKWFSPLSVDEVERAIKDREIQKGSCWVTFDDRDHSVVRNALPILVDMGIPATLFVCPRVMDSSEPFWWEIVNAATEDPYPSSGWM